MRDGAALDIDDVLRHAEVSGDGDRDGRKRLIDLNPLDITGFPTGAVKRLASRPVLDLAQTCPVRQRRHRRRPGMP